jgi:hypothetical protein
VFQVFHAFIRLPFQVNGAAGDKRLRPAGAKASLAYCPPHAASITPALSIVCQQ